MSTKTTHRTRADRLGKDTTMAYGINDIYTLADSIYRNHSTFAGIKAGRTRIWDTLMRTRDYLRKEKAARSANFTAVFYAPGTAECFDTVITIGLAEDGESITFTERRA